MAGRNIAVTAKDGGTFNAYLATPPKGSGPAIVVLQEIFGVNGYIRSVADQYAALGYVALAPDLYWRIKPGIELDFSEAGRKQAFDYFGKFDLEAGVGDIDATISALHALPDCTGKIGAIGFCLGGLLAFRAAALGDIDGAVSYYGVGIEHHLDKAQKIACPMLLHYAEKDHYSPPPVIAAVRQALAGHKDVEIEVYPGVDHAFSRVGGSNYNEPAAAMAHQRSTAFFRRTLGAG